MRSSLGVLLALCLAGLQFIAVLVVVSSSYFTSERALINHARDLLRDVGTNAIEHSKGFLAPARAAAELAARLAENRIVASDDVYHLEPLLFQQLQMTPQFSGLYFGDTGGDFVMVMRSEEGPAEFRSKLISHEGGLRKTEYIWRDNRSNVIARELDPADTYDPRERNWFQLASQKLTTIWTDPYIFFTSQQPGITLAAPVLDGESIEGVVGVDIEISRISTFLSGLKIGASGKALIIHRNGDVVAHPQPELLKARNQDGTLQFAHIRDFDDPIARAAFGPLADAGQIPVSRETPAQFTYQGRSYVSTLMPVISDILPWTIAVYAPEDDFTAVLKRNRLQNIWIAAAIAVLTGLVGLALADWLHRPVRAFAVRSSLIAQGEIDPSKPAPRTYRELERANEALVQQIVARRDAEREYGQTFELSARAMAQISPVDGAVRKANAKFGEILGMAPEETIGLTLADVAHPDDLTTLQPSAAVAKAETTPNHEMRWLRRDGSEIWVKLNTIIIRDDQGQPVHAVLTVDDVTEEKKRAGQISQLSRDLSHLARGNTLGQMAAGLAHELNQPLTAIAQNAGTAILALEQQEKPDPELDEILHEIEEQSIRAGDIIRALRGFIRKDESGSTNFDFGDLLDQTLRLVHAEAVEARAQITTHIAPIPKIHANRVQIAQVLVNLLRNAIEVLEDHEGVRRISVLAERDGDRVKVTISDTGPGVAEGIALFTQFETSKPEGMGLGLSICRSIIEANGGQLWHEKVEPHGARFCFTLATSPSG